MKTTCAELHLTFSNTDKPILYLPLNVHRREAVQSVSELKDITAKGKLLSVEIKQYRQRRSLDANSYLWVVCQKIAEVIGNTKEAVYQKFIREVGQFDDFPILDEAVETFIRRWDNRGLGDFAEVQRPAKIEGYTVIRAYYGSSVYDSKEMSILIDEIVTEAKELGIDVIPDSEKDLLLQEWGSK